MVNLNRLFLVGFVTSLNAFAGSLIAPIEARYVESITGDSVLTGTVFGFASVVFALASYWLGRFSDRWGRKKVILVGLCSGIVYALLYASVINIFQIYGVKFAWAFAAVALGPVMQAYLQDILANVKDKGKWFGYIFSAQSIFGSVGALTGGFLAKAFGLTAPFYVLMIVYLVALTVVAIKFKELKVEHKTSKERQSLVKTFKYIFTKPELLFYLSCNLSFGVNWGIKAFIWPLLIFSLSGNDMATGGVYATMGVIAFILLPFAGKIVDRYGAYKISFIQFLVLAACGTTMALTDSLTVFWVMAAFFTVGEVLNVSQFVIITEAVPSAIRGEVLGLDAAMDQFLMIGSPLLAGVLIALFGLSMTLLAFVSLYWISLLLGFYIYKTKIITR